VLLVSSSDFINNKADGLEGLEVVYEKGRMPELVLTDANEAVTVVGFVPFANLVGRAVSLVALSCAGFKLGSQIKSRIS